MKRLTPRTALVLFLGLVVVALAQAVWWIVLMARLTDEQVEMARELGATDAFIETVHQEEISRQIMVGTEGLFFLVVIIFGAWLIYRALVRTEELKFHHDNFMMSVTHELRTPLASLRVYLDTLQSPKIPAEKKERVLPRMREDADRLERLVDNILQAGRFERGEASFVMRTVDFSSLVTDSLERLERFASDTERTINHSLESDVMLEADAEALRRAVDVLLENSLKYHDGGRIVVDVTLESKGSDVFLTVSDQGKGLLRKDVDRVFDRFYRVDNELSRNTPGSGLGLYLCREIIRNHGGDVTAESEGIDKGTTFAVRLKSAGKR